MNSLRVLLVLGLLATAYADAKADPEPKADADADADADHFIPSLQLGPQLLPSHGMDLRVQLLFRNMPDDKF